VPFTVRPPDVPEIADGEAAEVALANARAKARAVACTGAPEAVLACDTVVVLDGRIFGKPLDRREAGLTLAALADRTHEVVSGLVVELPGGQRSAVARTQVRFRALDADAIEWYLATGEWRGRAGGYAIQGAGAALVRSVEGDYENVVGLPLASLLDIYPELLAHR
jgi:septum formation protein